jgi:hypothetical protein
MTSSNDRPSVLDLLQTLKSEDLPLPPRLVEMYGWARLWHILWKHPTTLLEVVSAAISLIRGSAIAASSAWVLGGGLALVGLLQVWAVCQRHARLRVLAALLSMMLTGAVVATFDLSPWQGYISVIVMQGWIVIRSFQYRHEL